jgi:broad specificity phosphatase PhoE
MRTIYLVRHPATPWSGLRYAGRTDLMLSVAGRHQAEALAHVLSARVHGPARVVSSPLARAAAAAERIARAGGWPLSVDDRWREVDFGAAEGLTFGELACAWPELARRLVAGESAIDWPSGEQWDSFHERVVGAWRGLAEGPGRTAIVVSHGLPIATALSAAGIRSRARRLAPAEVLAVRLSEPPAIAWSRRPAR